VPAARCRKRPTVANFRIWKGLRRWERHRADWDRDRDAGQGGQGSTFWDRLMARVLRPYNVQAMLTPAAAEIHGWRSPGACHALLSIVCLAWALDKKHRVLVAKLEQLAAVVGFSRSTVQRALDDLVASGAIERRHHFERVIIEGAQRHAQLPCTYRPGPWLRERLRLAAKGRSSQGVHREQATKIQTVRKRIEGVPCRGTDYRQRAPEEPGAAQLVAMLRRRGLLATLSRKPDRPAVTSPPPLVAPEPSWTSEAQRRRLAEQLGCSTALDRRLAALEAQP